MPYPCHQNKEFVLIGNKIDLEDKRVVSQKGALAWCAKHSQDEENAIPYFEIGAKQECNVQQAFYCMAKNALKKSSHAELLSNRSFPIGTPRPVDAARCAVLACRMS